MSAWRRPPPPDRGSCASPAGRACACTAIRTGASVLILGASAYRDAEGVWSATAEWLGRHLARERPHLAVAEMRWRNSSWRRLGMGVQDGAMAVEALTAAGRARER